MDVLWRGPGRPPAVALLTRSMRADVGVMISASHNRYEDNGIKLFGPDGYKLPDAIEAKIEAGAGPPRLPQLLQAPGLGRAKRGGGGRAPRNDITKRPPQRNLTF